VPGAEREYGKMPIEVMPSNPLFADVPSTMTAWMNHGDRVEAIPATLVHRRELTPKLVVAQAKAIPMHREEVAK